MAFTGNFSRRGWLQSAAGAAAAMSLGTAARPQEYKIAGSDIKLGVASYSFAKFSREQAIQMMKELGTPYLNVKDFHLKLDSTPEQIAQARKEFDDAGIILVGCGNVSFDPPKDVDVEEYIKKRFQYAKAAGFPLIVCAPTAETLPKMEKYVKEYDIKIAIHNHGPEDKHFPTPQSVLEAVKGMDPRCGLCMDIGHTSRTGVDIVEWIDKAGPRLLDMHAKDLADPMVKTSQVPTGKGKLPIGKIFEQLVKMNYKGSVNLEYEIQMDAPMPGMQMSLSYMRGVLTGLQAARQA
jgi:sugar phosphate isomerase/epimerase